MGAAYAPPVVGPQVSTGGVHRLAVRVGWGHCDPAGIVYFPRFFEMFHEAMETWFADHLGVSYREVIVGRKIGFPAVHTEADFTTPSAFGDRLVIEQRVERLGRRSITFAYRVLDADAPDAPPRLQGRTVCAVMDLDPGSPTFRRAVELPADVRRRIEAFGAGAPLFEA
jgi:4-hydroxybenzoyl-CoA thioesterase